MSSKNGHFEQHYKTICSVRTEASGAAYSSNIKLILISLQEKKMKQNNKPKGSRPPSASLLFLQQHVPFAGRRETETRGDIIQSGGHAAAARDQDYKPWITQTNPPLDLSRFCLHSLCTGTIHHHQLPKGSGR